MIQNLNLKNLISNILAKWFLELSLTQILSIALMATGDFFLLMFNCLDLTFNIREFRLWRLQRYSLCHDILLIVQKRLLIMRTVRKHGTSILWFHTPFLSPLSLCHSIASLMVDRVTRIEVVTSHLPLPPLPVYLPDRYHPVWPTVYPKKLNNDFEYRGKVFISCLVS